MREKQGISRQQTVYELDRRNKSCGLLIIQKPSLLNHPPLSQVFFLLFFVLSPHFPVSSKQPPWQPARRSSEHDPVNVLFTRCLLGFYFCPLHYLAFNSKWLRRPVFVFVCLFGCFSLWHMVLMPLKFFPVLVPGHFADEMYQNAPRKQPVRHCLDTKCY